MQGKRRRLRDVEAEATLDLPTFAESGPKGAELPLAIPEKALDSDIDTPEAPPSDTYDKAMRDREWAASRLVEEFADAARARVCRKVVSDLRRIPDTLSGDDSQLRNTWEEICVQMQTERSFYWDFAYIPTIEQLIRVGITKLCRRERQAIWLQSNEGSDWLIGLDLPAEGPERGHDRAGIPDDDDTVTALILDDVLTTAAEYGNSRIRSFIDDYQRKDYVEGG